MGEGKEHGPKGSQSPLQSQRGLGHWPLRGLLGGGTQWTLRDCQVTMRLMLQRNKSIRGGGRGIGVATGYAFEATLPSAWRPLNAHWLSRLEVAQRESA